MFHVKHSLLFLGKAGKMATKKQMIKTINAANKRMQRLRKKGYMHGDEYRKAQVLIARVEKENPFSKGRITLKASMKMSAVELKERYKVASQIQKKKELTVQYIKKEISDKRVQTFETEKGVVIRNRKKFFDLLDSDSFKNLVSATNWGSEQVLRTLKEEYNRGKNPQTLQEKLDTYMASASKDGYYLDSFEKALK